ncbi:uncharacterized protein LOC117298689 [Asterias rubens]|uniref:uncharacterized protein LOC117298689 n=1 Tax=Asterias rubens TaxID=7604 RepID=UPI001455247C|nr:uncharacterized protein LOC117298689 [Asterias rubens]
MASNRGQSQAQGPGSGSTHPVSQTASERGVRFLLHTGLIQPLRVDFCFDGGSFPMEKEGCNTWSCKHMPPPKLSYYYKFCTNSLNPKKFEQTPQFQMLPSRPLHVHHDILLPNLPTSYLLGLVFHLQDIYNTKQTNVQTKINEMLHLLSPFGRKELKELKELRKCLPYYADKMKNSVLLVWIIQSIEKATSHSQLTVLSVLVAYLNPRLDIVRVIEDSKLRKLIGSLYKADKYDMGEESEDKLKSLVPAILKRIGEFHWLYMVLYCFPLFDESYILQQRKKLYGKAPCSHCVSATLLPRLQQDRFNLATKKIIVEIEELQEKEKSKDQRSPKQGLLKNQTNDPLSSENDLVHDPSRAMEGTADSAQDEVTHQETPCTEESAENWVSHSFCILLEAENVKEMQLVIQEEGSDVSVHTQTFLMTQSKVTEPFFNKTWWKGKIDIHLPEKPKYTYKYMNIQEGRFWRSIPTTEQGNRTIDSTVHEDIFNHNLSVIQEIIGHTHYKLELRMLVNKENLTQHLFNDGAKKLDKLAIDIRNKNFLKNVQSHILSLIDSVGNTDAQIIFLASLLGIFTFHAMPSLTKVATTILKAFQNCKDAILPSLEKQHNKVVSGCLMEIVRSSIQVLKGSWLQLVFYTYPASTATELCSLRHRWPRVPQTAELAGNEEEFMSACFKHFGCKEDERLLSLVFQSIADVKLLLQVLKKPEHAHIFQDDNGYRSWVKDALQRRMQSMKPEDIHSIWKEVAETDVSRMHLLGKELVLDSLSHSREWSTDANMFMRSLLYGTGFWTTYQDHQLSDSLLKVLHKMLEQKDTQEGIDLNLEVVSMQWITKWLSLEDLQRLTGTMFEKQLQSGLQPAQVVQCIYTFLSTVHSIQWFSELSDFVEQLDVVTLGFIMEKKYQDRLLEIVFGHPKRAQMTLPDSGMKLIVKHLISSIQSTSYICDLLKPYAPKGVIDLHSRNEQAALPVGSKVIFS